VQQGEYLEYMELPAKCRELFFLENTITIKKNTPLRMYKAVY